MKTFEMWTCPEEFIDDYTLYVEDDIEELPCDMCIRKCPGPVRSVVTVTNELPTEGKLVDEERNMDNECTWSEESPDVNTWYTDCGESFSIDYDTPEANGMKFCCFCGKPIKEERYVDEEPDHE